MAFKKKVINETPSTENTEIQETSNEQAVLKKQKSMADIAKEAEKAARKLRKVTIHYNDPRDSTQVTTAYANCTNQFFSLAKIVPLDMTIELEQCLCDNLAEATIQVHVPDGDDTGNMVPRLIKKYSVIYED